MLHLAFIRLKVMLMHKRLKLSAFERDLALFIVLHRITPMNGDLKYVFS